MSLVLALDGKVCSINNDDTILCRRRSKPDLASPKIIEPYDNNHIHMMTLPMILQQLLFPSFPVDERDSSLLNSLDLKLLE